jgi:hypothetical protein
MAKIIREPRFIIDAKTNLGGQAWTIPTDSTSKRNNLLSNYWGASKRKLIARTADEIEFLLTKSVDVGLIMVKVDNPTDPVNLRIRWLPCDLKAAKADETDCEYYIIEDMYLTKDNEAREPGGMLTNDSRSAFAATMGKNQNGDHYLIINAVQYVNINDDGHGGEPAGVGIRVPPPPGE